MVIDAERGAVWLAWGEKFVDEAIASVASFKALHQIPCILITDVRPEKENLFDDIIVQELSGSYKDKILIKNSPFEKTIFFDTDTEIFKSFEELYDALGRFDFAFQPADGGFHYNIPNLPMEVLPEPSAGIIAWRKSSRTDHMFELWERAYANQEAANGDGAWDQRSLREALWLSDVSLLMLGRNWQVVAFDAAVLLGKPRMLHGRGRVFRRARETLFSSPEYRLFVPELGVVHLDHRPSSYFRLSLLAGRAALKRSLRLTLHYLRIWPLPGIGRRM